MKSPSSSLNVTVAQALCVFIFVQYLNVKNYGFCGYLYHLAGSPKGVIEWIMVPLMFPIELITQLSRPLTLAFRLFGNMMGEDILISYFALLGVSILPYFIPIPLQVPFLFLALFTGFVQALVFTLLTTVYILLSIPDADKNHHAL
jgi:F-type H+-transporting ATPase subunit a